VRAGARLDENLGLELRDRSILVLEPGRGPRHPRPAARLPAAHARVSNRTHAKAQALAAQFAPLGPIEAIAPRRSRAPLRPRGQLDQRRRGSTPRLATSVFAPDAFAYDLVYADQPTQFVRWAAQHGAPAPPMASAC